MIDIKNDDLKKLKSEAEPENKSGLKNYGWQNLFARKQIDRKRKMYSAAWKQLEGLDIHAEYELIMRKASALPRVKRDLVIACVIAEQQEAAEKATKAAQDVADKP